MTTRAQIQPGLLDVAVDVVGGDVIEGTAAVGAGEGLSDGVGEPVGFEVGLDGGFGLLVGDGVWVRDGLAPSVGFEVPVGDGDGLGLADTSGVSDTEGERLGSPMLGVAVGRLGRALAVGNMMLGETPEEMVAFTFSFAAPVHDEAPRARAASRTIAIV
jgi:hypothetical protein